MIEGGKRFCRSGLLAALALGLHPARAEEAGGASKARARILELRAEIVEERRLLAERGASATEIREWVDSQQGKRETLAALAAEIASQPAPARLPVGPALVVPDGASGTLAELLTKRAEIVEQRARLLAETPRGTGPDGDHGLLRQGLAAGTRELRMLAARLAEESASRPLPAPHPSPDPRNVSPELADLLAMRSELAGSRSEHLQRLAGASPAERAAALADWQAESQARHAALRERLLQLLESKPPVQPQPIKR